LAGRQGVIENDQFRPVLLDRRIPDFLGLAAADEQRGSGAAAAR
jgi:hypothetical protein